MKHREERDRLVEEWDRDRAEFLADVRALRAALRRLFRVLYLALRGRPIPPELRKRRRKRRNG